MNNFKAMSTGVEIGFVQMTYNVSLADGMVLVCATIYKGTLERSVAVQMITTSDTGSIGMYLYLMMWQTIIVV